MVPIGTVPVTVASLLIFGRSCAKLSILPETNASKSVTSPETATSKKVPPEEKVQTKNVISMYRVQAISLCNSTPSHSSRMVKRNPS